MHALPALVFIPKPAAEVVGAARPKVAAPPTIALAAKLATLIPSWPRCSLVVALSGGVDSVVLLHLLVQLRRQPALSRRLRLRAVHVDHHLQSQSAAWRRQCAELARRWRVPFIVRHAHIDVSHGVSVEAAAREARYGLLARALAPGDYLLTAQHQDDQLETFLLQLLRGAGPAGLAAMPEVTALGAGQLLRPLLQVRRHVIQNYATANDLRWIDDPSNADLRFDRNYLRAQVLPALRARWPSVAATVSRAARHQAEAQALIREAAHHDLAQLECDGALELSGLRKLSGPRQRAVLRQWLAGQGCRAPDAVHLQRMLQELPAARADANPLVRWEGGAVRRYQGLLLWAPTLPRNSSVGVWHWRHAPSFDLGAGWGELRVVAAAHGPWLRSELPSSLSVGFRSGGERVPVGKQHRTVKELLRSAHVLPWMRAHVPLVSAEAHIWCIPQLYHRPSDAAARSRRVPRVTIEWRNAPVWRLNTRAAPETNRTMVPSK